jgi:signal transduction histidine kinase
MKQLKGKRLVGLNVILVIVSLLIMGCVGYSSAKKAVYLNIEDQLQNEANDWKLLAQSYAKMATNQEQAKEEVKSLMASQVIGESGYIWVTDSDGVYIVSKNRLRDGEDISNSKDADGVLFIQEAIRKAKSAGTGTAIQKYPWKNIGESKSRMKVAGLSYMSEWDWVIGPSAYYDDFDNASLNMVRNSLLITGIILILIVTIFAFAFMNKK